MTPMQKPMDELTALRLEKAELETTIAIVQAERLRERYLATVAYAALLHGGPDWTADIPNRLWRGPSESPRQHEEGS
jgi:hypothetical protein